MSLKLEDLKVGDTLRSKQNNAFWNVTEIRTGVAIARNVHHGGTTWIKRTTLGNFEKVDASAAPEPNLAVATVRERYDFHGGVMAVVHLLADRADTPEEFAKAKRRGFTMPYHVSMLQLITNVLDVSADALTPHQRDQLTKVRQDVSTRLQRGNDRELENVYAAGLDAPASSAPTQAPKPRHPRRGGRWQASS